MGVKPFGKTNEGKETSLYSIENEFIKIEVSDYGATLVSATLKGNGIDVVQGFTGVTGYQNEVQYMGQTIGRVCNRIGKGEFILNGVKFQLAKNNNGNSLHGGEKGFDQKIWIIEDQKNKLSCTYFSQNGEEGYPGNLEVKVIYSLLEDGFSFEYEGKSDQDTLFNITNHAFFNLDGVSSNSALEHKIKIEADYFASIDERGCTQDEVVEVKGTAFDFTRLKALGQDIDKDEVQLKHGNGYDHHFLVRGTGFRKFVECQGKEVKMILYSDCPGMHLYSANFLDGMSKSGKWGGKFPRRSSVCFETQYYPNAIQTKNNRKPILKKGEELHHITEFRFQIGGSHEN
ncbi:MAG: aldose epimerase family protein [Anaerorhabdus sp.]